MKKIITKVISIVIILIIGLSTYTNQALAAPYCKTIGIDVTSTLPDRVAHNQSDQEIKLSFSGLSSSKSYKLEIYPWDRGLLSSGYSKSFFGNTNTLTLTPSNAPYAFNLTAKELATQQNEVYRIVYIEDENGDSCVIGQYTIHQFADYTCNVSASSQCTAEKDVEFTISGQCTDDAGNALERVMIEIDDLWDTWLPISTDANGRFSETWEAGMNDGGRHNIYITTPEAVKFKRENIWQGAITIPQDCKEDEVELTNEGEDISLEKIKLDFCAGEGDPTAAEIRTALGCIPTNPGGFIKWLFSSVLGLAGGIAFLIMAAGAFIFMTSQGNPEQINKGKDLIVAAITGLLFIIFSVFLLNLIGVEILQIPGLG